MADDFRLDHFLFYDVGNVLVSAEVGLRGQFDKDTVIAKTQVLDLYGNAVAKTTEEHEGRIIDPRAHLAWYTLFQEQPEPTRVVILDNQFGQQRLYTGGAQALLAPSKKEGTEPGGLAEHLDHFKVYRVLEGEPVNREVRLEDQFGKSASVALDPMFFAVPVLKKHDDRVFEINNPEDHLTIYRLRPNSIEERRWTADQFGEHQLRFFRSVLLAVPTKKLEWDEV